jgi:hypothetical protein
MIQERVRAGQMTPRQRQEAIQRLAEWTEEQARHSSAIP